MIQNPTTTGEEAVTIRHYIAGVGGLLIAVGVVFIILHKLRVFETCTTARDFYGLHDVCTQSPAWLIVGAVVAAVGLIVMIGALFTSPSS